MKNEHTVLLTCHKPDSWNMISQKSEQEQNLFPAHEGVKSNTVKSEGTRITILCKSHQPLLLFGEVGGFRKVLTGFLLL